MGFIYILRDCLNFACYIFFKTIFRVVDYFMKQ